MKPNYILIVYTRTYQRLLPWYAQGVTGWLVWWMVLSSIPSMVASVLTTSLLLLVLIHRCRSFVLLVWTWLSSMRLGGSLVWSVSAGFVRSFPFVRVWHPCRMLMHRFADRIFLENWVVLILGYSTSLFWVLWMLYARALSIARVGSFWWDLTVVMQFLSSWVQNTDNIP
jgi:hypothetical protein